MIEGKVSCEQAMQALMNLDQDPVAFWTVSEFIRQVDDLMKVRNMTIPMLLRPFNKENKD